MSQKEEKDPNNQEEEEQKDAGKTSPQKQPKFPYKYRQQHKPPLLSDMEKASREKGFVLDCVALGQISSDYSKANPKLGPAIPPYNSQKDPSVSRYFNFHGVEDVLITSNQRIKENKDYIGESTAGRSIDRFHEQGKGYQYLSLRNFNGMGHSYESISGHGAFLSDVKDVPGANGQFGYRRNTPWLRQCPSVFGTTNPASSAW